MYYLEVKNPVKRTWCGCQNINFLFEVNAISGNLDISSLDFSKHSSEDGLRFNQNSQTKTKKHPTHSVCGLIPAIIQNYLSGEVLMLGYMNKQALKKTIADKKVCFYSRSKKRLWIKGETSGDYLNLIEIKYDCDKDALVVLVRPHGNTCHLQRTSCFFDYLYKSDNRDQLDDNLYQSKSLFKVLSNLQNTINERKTSLCRLIEKSEKSNDHQKKDLASSYTMELLAKDQHRVIQKFGEEAIETVIALTDQSDQRIISESADLIYHLMCALSKKGLTIYDLLDELNRRAKPK